jgi:Holliday junction resolvase RusA-like endonuclease
VSEPRLVIDVYGQPAPQGSKRAFAVRGKGGVPTGRAAVIESSHDRVKSWRQAVLDEARAHAGRGPLDLALAVNMVFFVARPKGHYGSGRNAGRLRPSAPLWPAGVPDLSKLVRSTEDALTSAGIWRDDSLVVQCYAAKCYADDRPPGALITLHPATF